MIAVHSNDFPGQLPIADGVKQLQIDYPVAHDEAKATWRAYGIRFRPAHVLIAPDGTIVSQGIGLVTTNEVQRLIEANLPE